ncbi:phage tail tape measure protein [Nitrosospira sp. NpAV]|uniref:phage tail tape measure protein n=1 Tax=Nitrosospira sp. NpAV TaxID=58133 RepID=UPI0009FC402E|nr:phage tail tape measure protein [Nitrosospira sp. NpAV]
MANRDLTLAMKLHADATRFVSGLTTAGGGVRRFAGGVKREFDAIKGMLSSVEGKLASVGVSVGTVAAIVQSARMDKSLTQIGQTAGASQADVAGLRSELFRMAKDTGQNVEDLQQGFNNAVQSGLRFTEALPVLDATNKAMAVTGANADSLTGSLTVAATAFNFDLTKPDMAVTLLEKMTIAGRLGNAELENLSSIFGRIGPNAAAAGFGFDQTLAFVEGLSQIERQPERLATLADSTLRLFTNLRYMKEAQKATGVKFFDTSTGDRRDPMKVLADIKKQYDQLNTEKDRSLFVQKAFGNADLDTIKGMRVLLSGDMLGNISQMTAGIGAAGGTFAQDMPGAINNAIDQVGRLKASLRNAADSFIQPINAGISDAIKTMMDSKSAGGMGLDGKDMLVGGAAGLLGLFGAGRYGGKAIGALAKRFGGTAAGLAEGKALEAAAGVTPVYVVNMPGGGLSNMTGGVAGDLVGAAGGGMLAKLVTLIGGGMLAKAGLVATAVGATGYGLYKATEGTEVGNAISATISKALSFFSNQDAQQAIALNEKLRTTDIGGTINIRVDSEGRAGIVSTSSSNKNVRFNVDAGMTMAGAM